MQTMYWAYVITAIAVGIALFAIVRHMVWRKRWAKWPRTKAEIAGPHKIDCVASEAGNYYVLKVLYKFRVNDATYVGRFKKQFEMEFDAREFGDRLDTMLFEVVYNPNDPDVSQARVVEDEQLLPRIT
jgi:hypothetical protein